jgi:hypothetical protein
MVQVMEVSPEAVRKWLADPKRKRWHLHFTPTSASWLNLIGGHPRSRH